jgi:hypothetical protein
VVVTENWMLDLYAAVPLGLSRTFIRAPARRAFQERVEGGMGWYAGGALGMVWRLRPFNFIGELGYLGHVTPARTTLTVNGATTVEDRSVVDHEIALTFAGGVAF